MGKWRLLITSLPYALAVIITKLVLLHIFEFEGLLEINEIRLILTAGVFLIGFMLAGTMSDYKESERIPGEIASTLEAIEEITLTLAVKTEYSVRRTKEAVLDISQGVHQWFYSKISADDLHDKLYEYNAIVQDLDKAGGHPPVLGRLIYLQNDLRKLVTRANVISKTGFLSIGYALLELLVVIITILLIFTHFTSSLSNIFIVLFVEMIYIYMYKLIRDIDDPFEYDEEGEKGQAEVDLFPLEDYIKRLERRLEKV